MIHTIKNIKWVLATFSICVLFGLVTFFTLINQSFVALNTNNLQILLFLDVISLLLFFYTIFHNSYKIFLNKKKTDVGRKTSYRYFVFFTTTTLVPSLLVAVFSLILFNVGLQKFFNKQIKTVVNSSAEVAKNYVDQTKDTIEADILLMLLDINNKSEIYYNTPSKFLAILSTQRMLRRLDEVHLLDSSGQILMSNIIDANKKFITPPEEAFLTSLNGKPVRIIGSNRTSALVKLDNFIDTYLYIVKFMDPKLIDYIKETNQAVSFYYNVRSQKTKIKVTFALIYLLIVSLLLFISVIISIRFSSRLTVPIINLISASEKISSGDLKAKVPIIKTDKEFQQLNDNFNLMIDKLNNQQEKLLLSERHEAWESVARKLAHEIKNPLTPIQLSIDRLKEKYLKKIGDDKENFLSYLNTMNKQIKDIEYLLNEFSDFARMPKPIFKKINLNEIILRALKLQELSQPNIKFVSSNIKSTNFITADEEQLNRAFINLLKNSIESINEKRSKNDDFKGKINIDIRVDNDYIYVTILDNGIGFDLIDKKKMLTPYFTTKKDGTGLGLAIVGKIINDHNSIITFKSNNNNGAKVEITIPKFYDK